MPFPDALLSNPKIIFFTDFDGTITLKDSNDFLTDNYGFGLAKRRQCNFDQLSGKCRIRESFRDMIESWQLSLPECLPILLENIQLDPYFSEFFDWTLEKNIPVIVLSLGIEPIIRVLLEHLLGEDKANKLEIVGNMAVGKPPINDLNVRGGWTIGYHDDSGYGHDKSLNIRPYAKAIANLPRSQRPTLLYAGDGASDLSAAQETDLLFAKRGKDLVTFCQNEGVPFTLFDDWSDIISKTKDIYAGRTDVRKMAEQGREEARMDPDKVFRASVGEPRKMVEMVK